MLIIFEFSELPGFISEFTDLKKRRLLRLLIVFFANISLYGSPSSISNSFLITFSLVTLFPKIFIFSTNIFSDFSILNWKLILFSIISSWTVAEIDSNCSSNVTLSISCKISSTLLIE